jgi:hypothetical protein
MNNRLEQITAYAQGIIDATQDLPEQYAQKIEELIATVVSVAAMADGVHTQTLKASDLVDGRNDIGNGIIAYKEGNEIRLARD